MAQAQYTDKAAVENYLLISIDNSFDSQLEGWINAVSKHIEQITGRVILADDAASTRLYAIDGWHTRLVIDDCVEVTKVETGDTYGDNFSENTDYVLLPLNETPKNAVVLKNQAWPRGTHRITAKWGSYVDVPDDIAFVATVLVAGIVNAQVGTGTAKKSERIGAYTIQYADDRGINDYDRVMAILDTYKRYTL